MSTRKVDDPVAALGVESGISKSEVSRIFAVDDAEVGLWRSRPLDHVTFPCVFLDATYCKPRVGGRVVSRAIGIATGVSADGRREALGSDVGTAKHAAGRHRARRNSAPAASPTTSLPGIPWCRRAEQRPRRSAFATGA